MTVRKASGKTAALAALSLLLPAFTPHGDDDRMARGFPVIIRTIPHDPAAFTQGLLFHNGLLYESTGLYGMSSLRCLDPADGRIVKSVKVPDVFGEGLTRINGELVQLTWKEKTAFVYSLQDFSLKRCYPFKGEGWGLTSDSSSYIMSNGSDTLFIRSRDFSITKKVPVTLLGRPVKNLNELEYVDGIVYANVWPTSDILAIALKTGKVQRVIDCSVLLEKIRTLGRDDVLNGIAFNPKSRTFYVTGKNWPCLFEATW